MTAPKLAGPADGWVTPRLPTTVPGEIKVRLIRNAEGLAVHVTAPSVALADRIIREWFGPDQPYMIELCG